MRHLILVSLLAVPACIDDRESLSTARPVTSEICPADVLASLAPDEDQDLAFTLDATRVQKYACVDGEWVFTATGCPVNQPDCGTTPQACPVNQPDCGTTPQATSCPVGYPDCGTTQ